MEPRKTQNFQSNPEDKGQRTKLEALSDFRQEYTKLQ